MDTVLDFLHTARYFHAAAARRIALLVAVSACLFAVWQVTSAPLSMAVRYPVAIGIVCALSLMSALVPQLAKAKARREQQTSAERVKQGMNRWKKISLYDPATAIFQSWYFELRLEEEVQRCRRYSQPMSVIVAKVRASSERAGRAPEELHAELAQLASAALRGIDISTSLKPLVYAFCLPNTDRAGAFVVGRRLREVFSAYGCSYGLACLGSEETGQMVLENALRQAEAGQSELFAEPVFEEDAAGGAVGLMPVLLRPSPHIRRLPGVVRQGQLVSLEVVVAPFESCTVSYITPAGNTARSAELVSKQADASGVISWSWRIGRSTTPGRGTVSVTSSGGTASATISIEKLDEVAARRPELIRLAS